MEISVRKVQKADQNQLDTLVHFGRFVHKHLDWRPLKDWLQAEHYFVACKSNRIVGALAFPPEPPGVCWLRLFTTSVRKQPDKVWEMLWKTVFDGLLISKPVTIAALSTKPWLNEFLKTSGFSISHNVIVLERHLKDNPMKNFSPKVLIRDMDIGDLESVQKVDQAAFKPLWQNSIGQIRMGLNQSLSAQVAEEDGEIVGYQISTPTPYGAHLARLAVHPGMQNKGVGSSLIAGLFAEFLKHNPGRITVNTQETNDVSQTLYLKTGFSLTGNSYPVYEYLLPNS